MHPRELTQSLKIEAKRLGFQLVGACPAVSPGGFDRFSKWLDAGYAGEMTYLDERRPAYQNPQSVMDGVASLLMLGMNYQTVAPNSTGLGQGRISRYAWGAGDYHDLIHTRLKRLKKFALSIGEGQGDGLTEGSSQQQRTSIRVRGVVDTAPLLEREFAQLAGIGWAAKNTMLINRPNGSWFFLAALLLNVELEYDQPFTADHCGTCTACLDACPTNAFPSAGVLDATKCISYLTIEHRTAIPVEMRSQIGDWILGCDICQEVCPWNRKSPLSDESAFDPLDDHNPIDLRELFTYDDDQFRQRFRKTPLWRPKRRGILRNAAIVLGNRPCVENMDALRLGINDEEPLVRGASAWALGQHCDPTIEPLLTSRLKVETEAEVRSEIENALESN